MAHYDLVIIGSGISGLSCAFQARNVKGKLKIKIIEAKGRVGGRIYGKDVKTKTGIEKIDVGGQWLGRSQIRLIKLVKELGLKLYNQCYDGKTINVCSSKEIVLSSSPVDMILNSFWVAFDLARGFKKIDELSQKLSLEDPLSLPCARDWDAMTIETAKRWIFSNITCQKMFDAALLTIFGFDASQASFLYLLLYVRSSGGILALVDDTFEGNAQEYKIEGGMFQVVDSLAGRVGHDNIVLESPVKRISEVNDVCITETVNGDVYKSDYVVLSIPPHLRNGIEFKPPLPFHQREYLKHLHTGHMIKCIITYEERFWVKNGLSGMVVHWPYYKEVEDCPVNMTFDATTASGNPALIAFIGGPFVTKRYDIDDDALKNEIIESLVRFFGEEARHPIDVVVQNWSKEEYNGGCPVTYSTPGAITLYGEECLRKPHGRIHFAGTETATIWRGYIEGAIQSGERAANEVLSRIDPTYRVENVVQYEDILIPGILTSTRNSYYAMTGILATITIATTVIAGMCMRRFMTNTP